ncbi:hypothetical protein BD413DRAFT_199110 [Trametes elegans]|nr:hypothetical protein BD413DRAFT_199110 [Trametes elegans]
MGTRARLLTIMPLSACAFQHRYQDMGDSCGQWTVVLSVYCMYAPVVVHILFPRLSHLATRPSSAVLLLPHIISDFSFLLYPHCVPPIISSL